MKKKIRFTLLPHGTIGNDYAFIVSLPHTGTLSDPNPKAEWIWVPSFSVLVEHPEVGWILYDTGSCPGDEKDRFPKEFCNSFCLKAKKEDFLGARLASLGLEPKDISKLVVSHMHWDHAGGLAFFSGTPAGADVYIPAKDFSYGLLQTHKSPVKHGGGGYFRDNFEFPGLTFHLLEEDESLAEGVDLVLLEGHTPGIIGLVLHLESGTVIFPSDAFYTALNYGPPARTPGIIYDSLGFDRAAKKLQRLEGGFGAKIIFPHDPEQFQSLKTAPYFYR